MGYSRRINGYNNNWRHDESAARISSKVAEKSDKSMILRLIKKSQEHLQNSKVDYRDHFVWAVFAGLRMIVSGMSSIVHAFVPAWFSGVAAKTIIDLYYERLTNHPSALYQGYIKNAKSNTDSV